eukprot:1156061-Pelagomonas_calceolata.AAC.9
MKWRPFSPYARPAPPALVPMPPAHATVRLAALCTVCKLKSTRSASQHRSQNNPGCAPAVAACKRADIHAAAAAAASAHKL